MADTTTGAASAPKPSSSVKLVLLGEAAVGKVRVTTKLHPFSVLPQSTRVGWHVVICCASLHGSMQRLEDPTTALRRSHRIYDPIEGSRC